LVVRRHADDALDALVGGVFAHHFGLHVVLPRRDELERRALRAGDRRRAGIAADQEHALLGDRLVHRHHHVGKRDAGDDGNVFLLDQLLHDLRRHVGLELAVFAQHLYRHAAELAAVAFHDQHKRVVLVLPQCALWAGQFSHEADFDRRLGLRQRAGCCHDQGRGECG
jgi:hypothetical protein